MAGLTEIELAGKSGTTPEEIHRLIDAGILTPGDGPDPFSRRDVARVRLALTLRDSGIQIESVGDAIAAGYLSFAFMDSQTYEWSALSETSYAKASAEIGLPMDLLQRLHEALGFVDPLPDDLVREDDLEMLPALLAIQGAGLTEAQMTRALRVYGENLRRVAQAEAQSYHAYIETPLLSSGMSERDMRALASQISLTLGPLLERVILWLYPATRSTTSWRTWWSTSRGRWRRPAWRRAASLSLRPWSSSTSPGTPG